MVALRPLRPEDADGMLEWMQDEATQKYFQSPMHEKTKEEVMEFIRTAKTEPEDGGSVHFAVVDDTDGYLGTVSLKNYSSRDRNAEFAISLRPCARGKGIGREAIKELLGLAFEKWGMERVYLNVLSYNTGAIRLYERCGFVYEGEFVGHLYVHGGYQNLRWYGMVKKEYGKINSRI